MWTDDLVTLAVDAGFNGRGVDITTSSKAQKIEGAMLASGVLAIHETSAGGPERTNTGAGGRNTVIRPAYIHVGAQLSVRATSYPAARARAQALYNAVVGVRNTWVIDVGHTVSGWYREINPLQEPFDMGVDDKGAARCGFNVVAIRRPD
jgi:hypothetical protein